MRLASEAERSIRSPMTIDLRPDPDRELAELTADGRARAASQRPRS